MMCRKIDRSLLSSILMEKHFGGEVKQTLDELSKMAVRLEETVGSLEFEKNQLEIRLSRVTMRAAVLEGIVSKYFTKAATNEIAQNNEQKPE